MPAVAFYFTSVISAAVWAPALLYSGYLIGTVLQNGWSLEEKLIAFGAGAVFLVLLAYASRRIFKAD